MSSMWMKGLCGHACYSHFTTALFRQDRTQGPGAHRDNVGFAADDGRPQRRLKLPAAQCHFCLAASWFHLWEELQTKKGGFIESSNQRLGKTIWLLMALKLHAVANQLHLAADLPLWWRVHKSFCSTPSHTHAAWSRFLNTSHSSWSVEPSDTWSMS